jgi:hypothetical protein
MLLLDFSNPFRNVLICESSVFSFPSFIIKIWIRLIMSILSVLPNWVLQPYFRIDNLAKVDSQENLLLENNPNL